MKATVKGPSLRSELRILNRVRRDGAVKAQASAGTDVLFKVRGQAIRRWWPQSVQARNKSFIRRALRVGRMRSATLRGSVYDDLGRDAIAWQAEGGTRTARGANRAIPFPWAQQKRLASGRMPKRLRPRANEKIFRKGRILYRQMTKKKVRAIYSLRPAVKMKKRFPFYERSTRLAIRIYPALLQRRVDAAMRKYNK